MDLDKINIWISENEIEKITCTFPLKMERVQAYLDGQPWNVLSTYQPSKEDIETRYSADYRIKKSKEISY